MNLPEHYISMRHKWFQTELPVEFWKSVISFEKIVKNYIELDSALNQNGGEIK